MVFVWSLLFASFAYWCVVGLIVAFAIILVIAVFLLLFLLFLLFVDLSDCKATTNVQISSFKAQDFSLAVGNRSQSRCAMALEKLSAEQRDRQALALADYPVLALANHFVAPLASYTGDRFVEIAPADNILGQVPAVDTHPRRWLVERCIFGGEIAESLEVGARTSAYVVHSLELRRSKRFRSGALSSA